MFDYLRPARVNVRVLFILVVVIVILGLGAYGAHKVRNRVIASNALAAGEAAFDREDWQGASKNFLLYLSKHSNDVAILKKYGQAQMSVHPLEPTNVGTAIGVYRRALRLNPKDEALYKELSTIYFSIREFDELSYIANQRLEVAPNDLAPQLWRAKALCSRDKFEEAQKILQALIKKIGNKKTPKEPEALEAALLLGRLAMIKGTPESCLQAQKWFDWAIGYDPQSSEVFAERAKFYRTHGEGVGKFRTESLAAARTDLERADSQNPVDPRVRLALSAEWMEQGDFKKARIELDAIRETDHKKIKEYFVNPDDLVVAKFLQAGELSLRTDNFQEGVVLADKVLGALKARWHRFPTLATAVLLYVSGNKVDQARKCLNEYLDTIQMTESLREPAVRVAFLKAVVAQADGQPYQVIECVEPLIPTNPTNSMLLKLLARAYSQTDQTRRAIQVLNQYLRIVPRDETMRMQLVREYLRIRDFTKGLEVARLAERADPTDLTLKLLRIEINTYMTGEKVESVNRAMIDSLSRELADLRKLHPDRVEVRLFQAGLALNQGHDKDAEKELKAAILECKDALRAQLQLAQFYSNNKRSADALGVLREACRRNRTVAAPWEALADMQLANRKVSEARETLKSGLAAAGNDWEKYRLKYKMGLMEIMQGSRPTGIEILKSLARERSRDIRTREILLELPEIRKEPNTAGRLIDELRQIQGQTGLIWRLRQASLWMASGDWRTKQQDILSALQRCIDADHDWSNPVLLMGQMYERLGNPSRAEELYHAALTENPTATDIAERLISLLENAKRFPDAMKVLDQVSANPQALRSRRAITALEAGDFAKAIEELKLRVGNDPRDVNGRALLARLLYQQTKDVSSAFRYLDEAQKIAPKSLTVTAARVAILKDEKQTVQARKILDDVVKRDNNTQAYLLRGGFFISTRQLDLAEKDYRQLLTMTQKGEGYDLLGAFYAETGKLDSAIAAWESGLKAFPDNLAVKRKWMKALLVRNKPNDRDQAKKLLTELEGKLSDDPDLLWVRGLLLLGENNKDSTQKAKQLLERVIQIEPTVVDAYLELIDIAMKGEDYLSARELALRALGSNPVNTKLLLARAQIERHLNNANMSIELARMVLKDEPRNPNALSVFIDAALAQRDPKTLNEAQSLIQEALKAKPDDSQMQIAYMLVLNALGQSETGITNLEAYVRTDAGKKSATALLALAEMYRVRSDFTRSAQRIDQAITLDPNGAEGPRERIILLATQNKFDDIIKFIGAYRAKPSSDPTVLTAAANALISSGIPSYFREAKSLLEYVISQSPQFLQARNGLGSVTYQMGDVNTAKQIYRKTLELYPNNSQSLNDLAWIVAQSDHDYSAALALAEKGVQVDPENVHLRDTRGFIYSQIPNHLQEAVRDFEKCVELTPPDSQARAKALLQLGRTCEKTKDHVRTRQCLQAAVKIDKTLKGFTDQERAEVEAMLKQADVGAEKSRK